MSAPYEFLKAIQSAGLTPPDSLIPDGKLHRFASNGKRGDDSGWYVFHDDGIPAGAFGCWRAGVEQKWRAGIGRPLTPAEEAALQARMDAARRARETEKTREHAEAESRAAATCKAATPASGDHPYLKRKGVAPVASLREIYANEAAAILDYAPKSRGEPLVGRLLVVPITVAGVLCSLEFIDELGRKSALYGGAKAGGYWAAQPLPDGDGAGLTLLIGEGVATVLSAREATGHPVIAALSSGNLKAVATAMRQRYPAARLVILADLVKDTGLPDPHAIEAALVVGGALAAPKFPEPRDPKHKDMNDMTAVCGREAVREAIDARDDLPPVESYGEVAPGDARWPTARAQASARGEPGPGNGAAPGEALARVLLARADTLCVTPIQWLWDGWLARGKLHMFAGAPGTGKSTIALSLAAVVTTGGWWPGGPKCAIGDVLVWSDEDDPADTLLPRFLAAGGDPRRLHIVTGTTDSNGVRQFDPTTDIQALITAAQGIPALALMIVDPVVTIVPGDSHKNTEVRRALRPLVGFATGLVTAVLGISHFTKGTAGSDPVERVTGSVAFGALPRVVMAAARVREGDTERRIFCRAKSNIGPDTGGWEYRLELTDVPGVPGVSVVRTQWGEALKGSARDLLAQADASSDPEERGKLEEAVEWLRELLKDGPVESKQIRSDAKQAGIAQPTVERAKTRLGVKVSKAGYQSKWRWALPEHDDHRVYSTFGGAGDTEITPQHENVDHLWKPTPLEPSCGAGSTKGDQHLKETPPSTPLEPSCGAGSTKGDHATEKNEGLDHL